MELVLHPRAYALVSMIGSSSLASVLSNYVSDYTSIFLMLYSLSSSLSEMLFLSVFNTWGIFSFFRSEFKSYLFRETFLHHLTGDCPSAPNPPSHPVSWCWGWNCKLYFSHQSTFLLGSTTGCIRPQGALKAEGGKKRLAFLPIYFFCHPGNSNWF